MGINKEFVSKNNTKLDTVVKEGDTGELGKEETSNKIQREQNLCNPNTRLISDAVNENKPLDNRHGFEEKKATLGNKDDESHISIPPARKKCKRKLNDNEDNNNSASPKRNKKN